jgi:hypothetical protein
MLKSFAMLVVLTGASALAQTVVETPPMAPPPMVPASPPPMPAADPSSPPLVQPGPATSATAQPGTPPPPSMLPPSYVPGSQPSQPGYQYSPYGQPQSKEKPGPEIGLMVSESLFGMLTAAGITILPYFLLFNSGGIFAGDDTLSSIIFILIFAATPLAVAQTEVGLANGSRYWFSETWPTAIAGLVGSAAVLGLYYLTGWLPTFVDTVGGVPKRGASCSVDSSGLQTCQGSLPLLLIGAIGVVPLLQMAVINFFKQPKFRAYAERDEGPKKKPGEGVTLAAPAVVPILMASDGSRATGFSLSLLRGTW